MDIAAQTAATAFISSLIGAVVAAIVSHARTGVHESAQTAHAMHEGMRCLMRQQIVDVHSDATHKGYITYFELQHATQVYDAYHALGGNGSATDLIDDIKGLPVRKTALEA